MTTKQVSKLSLLVSGGGLIILNIETMPFLPSAQFIRLFWIYMPLAAIIFAIYKIYFDRNKVPQEDLDLIIWPDAQVVGYVLIQLIVFIIPFGVFEITHAFDGTKYLTFVLAISISSSIANLLPIRR